MAKIIDRIVLDFNKDKLEVFENRRSALRVAGYIKAIRTGHEAPEIEVVKNGDTYQLCVGELPFLDRYPGYNYAGHGRSLSHYISGNKINCYLIDSHRNEFRAEMTKFFQLENSKMECFYWDMQRIANILRDFPKDVSSKFCNMCLRPEEIIEALEKSR